MFDQIITPVEVTVRHLKWLKDGASVFVLGSQVLKQALAAAGFAEGDKPDIVVVGPDPNLTFDKLLQASRHLDRGAWLTGTNPDVTRPGAHGPVPETGATLAFLEAVSGKEAFIIGKPNPLFVQLALDRLTTTPKATLMVGDTVDTDVAGGRAAGLPTALVLIGNARSTERTCASVVVRDLAMLTHYSSS